MDTNMKANVVFENIIITFDILTKVFYHFYCQLDLNPGPCFKILLSKR